MFTTMVFFTLFIYLYSKDFNTCNTISSSSNYISQEELAIIKKQLVENCSAQVSSEQPLPGEGPPDNTENKVMLPIECLINGDKTVQCLKDESGNDEIYMPYDFVKNYFEVYGGVKHYDGYERFEFLQSFAKVR